MKGIYKSVDTPAGTIGLTSLGEAAELQQVLVPTKLDEGAYDVSVTRKGKDLYRIDGMSTYVVTRYCYEYAYSAKAVLRYKGAGMMGMGSLVFDK